LSNRGKRVVVRLTLTHRIKIGVFVLSLAGSYSHVLAQNTLKPLDKTTHTIAHSSDGRYDGFAIAIAWPRALAKQVGGWYDGVAKAIGLNRKGYYRVGHSAVILVSNKDSVCHYFDFGRYHSPFGQGRVRNETTDVGLQITTKAIISKDKILNFDAILNEVMHKTASHASGPMHGSYCRVRFDSAQQFALAMQQQSPYQYDPFKANATNCSRFARKVILAGRPPFVHSLRIALAPLISPSPLHNLASLWHYVRISATENAVKEECIVRRSCPVVLLDSTLPAPTRPLNLTKEAQWLAGETAGSWFQISKQGERFWVERFCAEGEVECAALFAIEQGSTLELTQPYRFTFLSHCAQVSIVQFGNLVNLSATQAE